MKRKLLYPFMILTMLLLVVASPLTDSGTAGARAQSEKCKTCLEQARASLKKCMDSCDAAHGTADTFPRLQCRNGCRARPESNEYAYCSKAGDC
ncbi:MAG TPA: hypothetical protein VER76_04595 [Pyrinomonadaceae bacterium]|nr:hypothetical protein [Pyrinomonadaceae bacterium]